MKDITLGTLIGHSSKRKIHPGKVSSYIKSKGKHLPYEDMEDPQNSLKNPSQKIH